MSEESDHTDKDDDSERCEIHYSAANIAKDLSPKWANVLQLLEVAAGRVPKNDTFHRAYKKALETLCETTRVDELLATAAEHPGMKASWGRNFFVEDVTRFLRAEGDRLRESITATLPAGHRIMPAENGTWIVLSPHGLKCSLQEWLERPAQPGEAPAASTTRAAVLARLRECGSLRG
jgi:hypothetical protein